MAPVIGVWGVAELKGWFTGHADIPAEAVEVFWANGVWLERSSAKRDRW